MAAKRKVLEYRLDVRWTTDAIPAEGADTLEDILDAIRRLGCAAEAKGVVMRQVEAAEPKAKK